MKRIHYAILTAEALSYALMIVFIFADATFDLTGVFRSDDSMVTPQVAYIGACLIGVVGCINVWLTWYYIHKANTMRDWLIVCAWTHRIKRGDRWLTLEEFLTEHLGYQVSHGLSEARLMNMRDEVDTRWRAFPAAPQPSDPAGTETPPAAGSDPAPSASP